MTDAKDLKNEIDKVMADPKDKYSIRVAVTMDLTKKQFIMFLVSRFFVNKFLTDKIKLTSGFDTEFFKRVFMIGVRKVAKTVSLVSMEMLLKDIKADMEKDDDNEFGL